MSRPPVRVASMLAALALAMSGCGDAGEDSADGETTDQASAATDPDTGVTSSNGADAETDSGSAEAAGTDETDDPTGQPEPDEADAEGDDTDVETGAETGAPAADVVISGSFSGGEIQIEERRFDVSLGSSVLITFDSDQVEHIHLHGYDILADLGPGEPAEIAFVADSPGTFEVELEDSGRFLFELLVR